MDKWQKLKDFLTEGKQNIPKDLLVSKSGLFEEILMIMEELDKRELSEPKGEYMKRDSKTIIPYEDIDCELVELIKCINKIDGIETTECCCGHGTGPCQIWLKADSIENITHFIYNYLYCNPLWRIVVNLTDVDIDDNEWNNPTYLLETTCSDYFYTGVSIDNLMYKMQEKQRE